MNGVRLFFLKRKAKNLYLKSRAFYDRYSCGRAIADHINPEGQILVEKLRKVWVEIKQLDPSAPECPL